MSNKIGVKLKIAVNKIEKERLFKGKNTYLDATVFIDPDNPGQYGDHGMITQDVEKEERDNGVKGPILGNVEVFWRDDVSPATNRASRKSSGSGEATQPQGVGAPEDFDSDIPFAQFMRGREYMV